MANNEIKKKVLYTIQKLNKKKTSGAQYVIEVVSYNNGAPMLIKQQYYYSEDSNEWIPGKLKGLTYEDLSWLNKPGELKVLLKYLKPGK